MQTSRRIPSAAVVKSPQILAIGPGQAGVADAFAATVAALRAHGDDVAVQTIDPGSAPGLGGLRAAWRTRRALRAAEVLHVEFGANDAAVVWLALAATWLRGDCVFVAHDHPELAHAPGAALTPAEPRWARSVGHRVLSPLLDGWLTRRLVRRAGVVVGFGDGAAHARLAAGARDVATVPHGPLVTTVAPSPPSQGDSLLFAGFIGPSKGVDVLLEAWSGLGDALSLPLVLAGAAPPPHDAWLAGLLAGLGPGRAPRMLGAIDGEAPFQHVIERAAIIALPYRASNPASGVLVRAMSAGRAIVTTAVPATAGLVRDGENGLLVPAGDARALADAIRRLAADPGLRDRLGAAAANTARRAFGADAHVAALHAAYARARVS